MNKRTLTVIAALLLLAFLGTLFWGLGKSKAVAAAETKQAESLAALTEMEQLKNKLADDVDRLTLQYEGAAADNEELQGNLATAQAELSRARSALKRAKNSNANDKEVAYQMSQQIQELITVRSDLERSITVIQAQNDSLRSRTTILENQLSSSKAENESLASLNRSMQTEVNRLTLDNFKATAFRVEPLKKKGDKVTAKGGRVGRIAVSFDLTEVPTEYQGVRPLYLVITDESGTPITNENTLPTKVEISGQSVSIMPILIRDFNIEDSQRIDLNYELTEKLKAGFYQAKVYTDIGILGASSFRLR
ncbi:MAG: hypothetical protein AAF828_04905 [Bacteroidota bacterium]